MNAFPFPETDTNSSEIVSGREDFENASQIHYERRNLPEAATFRAQYNLCESRLKEIFYFVSPDQPNSKCYSVNIADLIKSSSNLYELISRWLYTQLFHAKQKELNVFHFLSLEKFLKISKVKTNSPYFHGAFDSAEIESPFIALSTWDSESRLQESNVPKWWGAYNKLKHSNSGLSEYGTLENAIASVSAVFLTLHHAFGPGMVEGMHVDSELFIHREIHDCLFTISYARSGPHSLDN